MFDKLQWMGLSVDLAVPVGKRIPPRALRWMQQFSQQHNRPLLYTEQIIENKKLTGEQLVYAFGPPAFQQQVVDWQSQGCSLW